MQKSAPEPGPVPGSVVLATGLCEVRRCLDSLWDAEEAEAARRERGDSIPNISLREMLGTFLEDWPLPAWAKWVTWVGEPGHREPVLAGMAYINPAYRSVWPHINPRLHLRAAEGSNGWSPKTAADLSRNDYAVIYGHAGPEFWNRIEYSRQGPSFWEETSADGHEPSQVNVVKSVARDRDGIIRLAVGMATGERTGAWRGRSGRENQDPREAATS